MNIGWAIDPYNRESSLYLVAYLDILGTTERIKDQAHANETLNILHNLYTFNTSTAKEIFKQEAGIAFRVFSDNLVVALPLSDNYKESPWAITLFLRIVSNIQSSCVGDGVGWLLRGGITIGHAYIDEVMVWGEALVEAYNLENNLAVFPRVVFNESAARSLMKHEELSPFVNRDFDGVFYLNYLSNWRYCGKILAAGFERMKHEVGTNIPPKVLQKLKWHMNYANRELEKKDEKARLVF
ncbi:hypothetical protein [Eggerthella sp. YY7918]|uniref:hypothetical protein n=1 Tax=Eggerthella sp. (strain YY7918) TaxID=502558 RepID=UPI0002171260|nr:hypothetical protein [Eggerthella sp. YY7918]BAK44745.1 adenosylmethionine-8-amino-7-oxononanoate aminotransferase [Eggerthella sp. YY7918]